MALVGSGVDLIGAIGVTRLLASAYTSMLMNSSPVLIGNTLLLVAVALIASWLRARRAARINPIEDLRAE